MSIEAFWCLDGGVETRDTVQRRPSAAHRRPNSNPYRDKASEPEPFPYELLLFPLSTWDVVIRKWFLENIKSRD